MKLVCESIEKRFGHLRIFRDINFSVDSGQSVAITGPNGSGKTTLIRILCGLIRANSGRITYSNDSGEIPEENIHQYLGLVGPYLELYEELSAYENLKFFAQLKKVQNFDPIIMDLLSRFRLNGRENDAVKTYSSGMRQRLKFVFALLNQPPVLFLDEPTSNLDVEGAETVYEIMQEQKKNKILVLATNDKADLKFGDQLVAVAS